MNTIYVDAAHSDAERRQRLYNGQLFVFSPCPSAQALSHVRWFFTPWLLEGLHRATDQKLKFSAAPMSRLKARLMYSYRAACWMSYNGRMIDFPIAELLDDSICLIWLERYLHSDGLQCRHCGSAARRLFRHQGHFPAYRYRVCDGYDTRLTGTVFEKTRQRPATLVLLLRGIAKGEPTARLAREVGLSRKPRHTLRHRIQAHVNVTAPTEAMAGPAFEADETVPERGGKKHAASRPADLPRRRANTRKGHGTSANDRPPIISVVSRETGEYRFWVCDHADSLTCHNLIAANVPAGSTRLYTDEWPSDRGSHRSHATVRHGMHEWGRDADGDGIREGTLPHLRGSRGSTPDVSAGVPGYAQEYLHLDVATDEAMLNTKRVTPQLIRRMCVRDFLA